MVRPASTPLHVHQAMVSGKDDRAGKAGSVDLDSELRVVGVPDVLVATRQTAVPAREGHDVSSQRLLRRPQRIIHTYFFALSPASLDSARIKASWGTSTRPTIFIRFLPSFCFSKSLRLRLMSPP